MRRAASAPTVHFQLPCCGRHLRLIQFANGSQAAAPAETRADLIADLKFSYIAN